jgi:hypothetical protein
MKNKRFGQILSISDRAIVLLVLIWLLILATKFVSGLSVHLPGDSIAKLDEVLKLCREGFMGAQ